MRRKERSGPGMGNWDDAVLGPASGVEVAVEETETAELAESPALADKQPREKSETITKTERQEGHFMAGSPLNQKDLTLPGVLRGEQGIREPSYALFLGPGVSGLRFQCRPKYAIFPDYPRNFVFLRRFSFYSNKNGGNGRWNGG
jgi:hypothetical protein